MFQVTNWFTVFQCQKNVKMLQNVKLFIKKLYFPFKIIFTKIENINTVYKSKKLLKCLILKKSLRGLDNYNQIK